MWESFAYKESEGWKKKEEKILLSKSSPLEVEGEFFFSGKDPFNHRGGIKNSRKEQHSP